MQEGEGFYRLRPEWITLADAHDAQGMAHAMYTDLKKHYYNGVLIPPEAIKKLMETVVSVLYSDHEWSEEDIAFLENKFKELNQYYPTETAEEDIPEVLKAVLPQLMKSGMAVVPSGAIVPSGQVGQVHMEFVRHKPRKQRRWDKAKTIVGAIFKTAVYWLALLGLLTLMGL